MTDNDDTDRAREHAEALFSMLRAPSDMVNELMVIATHGLPDADGNVDVGLLEPDRERTEIACAKLNFNDINNQAVFEYDCDIQGEASARVTIVISIRPLSDEEKAEWIAELERQTDENIARYGIGAKADELRARLGIAYQGDPERLK
jgi:hypothetical protein